LVLTLLLMFALNLIGAPLITEASPSGIISFEFAGTVSNARSMIESWGDDGQFPSGLSLGLDYLYLFSYSITIALGCVLVSQSLSSRVRTLPLAGVILAWAQFLAAILDALENYGLIRVVFGSGNELWPAVARWCAGPKFLIVALGLLYVLAGVLLVVVIKPRKSE
jgi:hypothetical protein